MPIEKAAILSMTDTITLLFMNPKTKQQTGDLNIEYCPFIFNFTEYQAMRQTLNESQLRQVRIDQLNRVLRLPVQRAGSQQAAQAVPLQLAAVDGATVATAAVSTDKTTITVQEYDNAAAELTSLLSAQQDATVFINDFMCKVTAKMDLLNNGTPYDWTDEKIKRAEIEALGFAVVHLAASTILERCSGGKDERGNSPLSSLVTVG